MQGNTIVFNVDTLNDTTTIVEETYTRFEEYLNRSKYVGETHSLSSRDELSLYRTFPKQAGNFLGVARSAIKFSYDITVTGVDGTSEITSPIIAEVSFSVPVGATAAETLLVRQRVLALLDLDAVMAPLNDTLMI
jgi:hypothetical protein